jgi:hypothetical protein
MIRKTITTLASKQAKSSLLASSTRRITFIPVNPHHYHQTRFYTKHGIQRETLIDTWKKTFKQEMEKNEEVNKLKEQLKETSTASAAMKAAEAAQAFADVATPIVKTTADVIGKGMFLSTHIITNHHPLTHIIY